MVFRLTGLEGVGVFADDDVTVADATVTELVVLFDRVDRFVAESNTEVLVVATTRVDSDPELAVEVEVAVEAAVMVGSVLVVE
jgi:hypothetical protein